MKRSVTASTLSFALMLSLSATAHAQKPAKTEPAPRSTKTEPAPRATAPAPAPVASPSAAEPVQHSQSPEMWLYEQQLRRYDDPRSAVREKAEFRAQQRMHRLAALEWYGFSNSRPRVNPTPWGATYSPSWAGGAARPYSWVGPRQVIVISQGGSTVNR